MMFTKLGEENTEFEIITGYLDKWKTRYGICQLSICRGN